MAYSEKVVCVRSVEVFDLHERREIVVSLERFVQGDGILGILAHGLHTQQTYTFDSFYILIRVQDVEQKEDGKLELATRFANEGAEVFVGIQRLPKERNDLMGPDERSLDNVQSITVCFQRLSQNLENAIGQELQMCCLVQMGEEVTESVIGRGRSFGPWGPIQKIDLQEVQTCPDMRLVKFSGGWRKVTSIGLIL